MSPSTLKVFAFLTLCNSMRAAPTKQGERDGKSMSYFDYITPEEDYSTYSNKDYAAFNKDYPSFNNENNEFEDFEENDISRGLPGRKRVKKPYDSPIYYIRLPPQPYMFVPGLGYISQPAPPPPHVSQFVNLPLNFVSNGKPSSIYQWNGAVDQYPTARPPKPQQQIRPKPAPKPPADSNIHRLPGVYNFNGKPNDVYVLRDSYNSLYSDALQNFYP